MQPGENKRLILFVWIKNYTTWNVNMGNFSNVND